MKREFNKYINTLTEKELIKELKKLYSKFDSVKKYYELELGDNTEKILDEFKEKIRKEYFPNRGFGQARSSVSKKVIADFKKISIYEKDVIELLLYRTEMMMEYTQTYGDIDQAFYNSLSNTFEQACKLIQKEKLESYFKKHCQELVSIGFNIGWGVSFDLKASYQEYFVD
jgi:hypothetical protein